MSPLVWAILLLVLGMFLLVLEMFIPSAGILSILAAAALIASIGMVFVYEPISVATLFLALVCVVLPLLALVLVKWWPRSPIGRRILNIPPVDGETISSTDDGNQLAELVGQRGRAKSKMLPSGAIEIAGRTFDAVSEGQPINPGDMVHVIQVRGNLIIVRPASDDSGPQAAADKPSTPSIETVVPDPFDDSLS